MNFPFLFCRTSAHDIYPIHILASYVFELNHGLQAPFAVVIHLGLFCRLLFLNLYCFVLNALSYCFVYGVLF